MKWKKEPGMPGIQAPISHGGDVHDYVISHRQDQHTVSYRPKGTHVHVGTFVTEKEAKAAAEIHAKARRAPIMTKKKMSHEDARDMLMNNGVSFDEDFHALSSDAVDRISQAAKATGYRKRKDAPGSTARMYYTYLQRLPLKPGMKNYYDEAPPRRHSTMKPMQFPRWTVDVTVGGNIVKTFHETATTSAAAIAKAKHKMRGAVSNAGAFKFKATQGDKPERHHATKKSPAQLNREISEALSKQPGSSSKPRVLKISRGKSFAGQRSITANVQYLGEKPMSVEFVGPSGGGSGPVVMVTKTGQTRVSDPARFGEFGAAWVRRFFG